MSNPKLHAILSQNNVEISLPSGEAKSVSYADFLSFIQTHAGNLGAEEVTRSVQWRLPRGIVHLEPSKANIKFVLYYPETNVDLQHNRVNRPFKDCRLPNVLIRGTLNKNRNSNDGRDTFYISDLRWYAVNRSREELPDNWVLRSPDHGRDGIWALPLPNMYSDARMCTGSNTTPTVVGTDLRILDALYDDILIRGIFNNDLNIPSLRNGADPTDMLSFLSGLPRYPYQILDGEGGESRLDRVRREIMDNNE